MKYLSILTKLVAVVLICSFIPIQPAQAFEQLPRSLRWELVSQSGTTAYNDAGYPYGIVYANPGDTVDMWVTVKNRSSNPRGQVWYGKSALLYEGPQYPNAHAIGVGTWDPMDNIPSFLDPSSFVINGNRLAYYDGAPIYKGQTMTLHWQVKVKDNIPNSTYNLVLSLVREFDEWGYRVTSSGANHRYQGLLWQFKIGDTTLTSHPLVFDFNQIKVGDRVGDMTITNIKPISSTFPLSWENVSIQFSGSAVLTYSYVYSSDCDGLGCGIWPTELGSDAYNVLPRMIQDTRTLSFRFSNQSYAKQLLGPIGRSDRVAVEIKNFIINSYPSSVLNAAELVGASPRVCEDENGADYVCDRVVLYLQDGINVFDSSVDSLILDLGLSLADIETRYEYTAGLLLVVFEEEKDDFKVKVSQLNSPMIKYVIYKEYLAYPA